MLMAATFVLSTPDRAFAQNSKPDGGALEQQYDAAFQDMLKQPANLDVLFKFATLASQTGDLEGAVSALERMLLIDPNLPRVRLELGVLYYRLGSYEVARTYIEAALKASALIGQACVIGDGRPYLTALLVLDPEVAPVWAAGQGIEDLSLDALAVNPKVVAQIQADVDHVNERFSQVEGIKRFKVLHEEWLADSEELTPTMKLRRKLVNEKYKMLIDGMYAEAA